jgi:hypothetical protein
VLRSASTVLGVEMGELRFSATTIVIAAVVGPALLPASAGAVGDYLRMLNG